MEIKESGYELHPEFQSIQALRPGSDNNAPSREVMFGSHFSQRPVIEGSESPIVLTGVEEEMGKYTFSVKMPEDGTIMVKIPKFATGVGNYNVNFNPETLVIYRGHESGELGCFTVPYYGSHDPVFGFKYEVKDSFGSVAPGADIPKGTVFADSPAVKGESHYTYSKNLNLAYMSHPNVGLDGYVIARDVLPYFKFRLYEKRSIEFGTNEFLLNLYGDDNHYKPFPDIGEYVEDSGLLAMLRSFNLLLAPALISKKDTRRRDYQFDKPVFTRPGKGRVVDINVVQSMNSNRSLPDEMTEQVRKYHVGCSHYHREIVRFYESQVAESRRRGNKGYVKLSPELHNLIVYAYAITNQKGENQPNLTLTYKKKPLDVWRVDFVIEYEITPQRGFKLSCPFGGKGVICRIEEPENMPVDADGNRADIISGPDSVPGRMNIARLHIPYFGAAARDVRKLMLETIGLPRNWKGEMTIEEVMSIPQDRMNKAIEIMLKYYSIISPRSYKEFVEVLTEDERFEWMRFIFNKHLYTYLPVDKDKTSEQMIKEIEESFKLVYGPVSYVGHSGIRKTTKNKVRIAPIPIMLLDKIADNWLSVDIGKHNNFGILAAMNRADKYSRPWKRTPPRTGGETEMRLYRVYGGMLFASEFMDRNGSIATQQEIAKNIIRAEQPTNVYKLVDREKIPFGSTRPLQIANQFFYCLGVRIVYRKEQQ